MGTFASYGKRRRMERLFRNGKSLIVPVDDSLIFGPFNGLYNLNNTIEQVALAHPSAVLGYKGSYSILMDLKQNFQTPFILNVTASTTMGIHISKFISSSCIDAMTMGVDCIAVHINFTSDNENDMLNNLARITAEADALGMPVLAIAYPRKADRDGNDDNYYALKEENIEKYTDLVSHCVRASVELGADIIKTQYTGSPDSFKQVIDAALGKPVVIAGGPLMDVKDSYKMAYDAVCAGASGVSFGRNVFNSTNIHSYVCGLKEIVFNSTSVEAALSKYWGESK